ncbi:MAG: site-specific DNA-methyltransferase [Thermoplasmatales archaeon]|nr:site-specific DNA-methyltransferase [Thermoplasmatales archaeon]
MTTHKLIIGDSRKMDELNDESVHLVVTSPPYPMIQMWDELFRANKCKTYDDMHKWLAGTWKECYRVLVDGGICCINIGDATRTINKEFKLYPNHVRITEICEKIGFRTLPYILWKKPTNKPNAFLGSGFLPPNAYVTLDCEYILIFRKGKLRKFSPHDKDRYTSTYTKNERDVWFSQIWDDIRGVNQSNGLINQRTAEFPKELPCRLIKMFSCVNDTILDPFLGTGTSMKVARDLGRNSVGYEINKDYIDFIKKKVEWGKQYLGKEKIHYEIVIRKRK